MGSEMRPSVVQIMFFFWCGGGCWIFLGSHRFLFAMGDRVNHQEGLLVVIFKNKNHMKKEDSKKLKTTSNNEDYPKKENDSKNANDP